MHLAVANRKYIILMIVCMHIGVILFRQPLDALDTGDQMVAK